MIDLNAVSFISDNRYLVDNVNLCIGHQDFFTFVGPNGVGKTLLLKLIVGEIEPSKGKIHYHKHLRIGYMPQELNINFQIPINVLDFMKLGNKISQARLDQVVKQLELEDILDCPVSHLSGGQKQFLLLARAILPKPDVLILDEPTQRLDVAAQFAFYKHLETAYQKEKMAIVMVSHDFHLLSHLSTEIIGFSHKIYSRGSFQEMLNNPELINWFGKDIMTHYQKNVCFH